MLIELKCKCLNKKCVEWAIIEIQGIIEPQSQYFKQNLNNLQIGPLCRLSQENYTFTVGYHELAGSKVALKKPLLVLRKSGPSDMVPRAELEVVGVIRHKILFKTRPKALISKPFVKERVPALVSK